MGAGMTGAVYRFLLVEIVCIFGALLAVHWSMR